MLSQSPSSLVDARYISKTEIVRIAKVGGYYSVLNHPGIFVAECPTCGGYRFQHLVSGACHGPVRVVRRRGNAATQFGSCLHKSEFRDVEEFARYASRYVKKCAVCDRLFVSGGGKTANRADQHVCHSEKCRTIHAELRPTDRNTCASCGKVCFATAVVTTSVLPHLYPERLFVGSEFCLCEGECTRRFRKDSDADLLKQVVELLAEIEAETAKCGTCRAPGMQRALQEKRAELESKLRAK